MEASSLPHRIEERFLHELISTVGSSLELEEVLEGVVRLLSDASAVHACFVYLIEQDPERLVLRAASGPYARHVGSIELRRGEGLAWWTLEHREAAFIREGALDDPRVKYVPELEEERFQSLVAAPLFDRRGEPIGAITLDTEAPREFSDSEAEFLVSSSSLVAGVIESARLYDEMRGRVSELEQLTELAEALVAAETLEELGAEVTRRGCELLGADALHLYVLDPGRERLLLRWSAPEPAGAPETLGLTEVGSKLGTRVRNRRLAVPLVAGDELLGALVATGTPAAALARALANQAAVAMKKIQVLDRLTERNAVKDFFDDLEAGRLGAPLEGRAARVGCELDEPYLVLAGDGIDERLESALAVVSRGALVDRREQSVRALLRVPAAGASRLVEAIRAAVLEKGPGATIGISGVCTGDAAISAGFEHARYALLGAAALRREPGVVGYDELGAYKYLLRIPPGAGGRDVTMDAVALIADYDREHGASLLPTLEEFLARRGNITATSEVLFIHPNTLRQRLRRIGELSGIDLRRDDWLTVEIALKLARLERSPGT